MKLFLISQLLLNFWFISWNYDIHESKDKFIPEFIHKSDFPIKIDGGCSFYTYDTTLLSKNKYLMVVSKDKIAFIKKNNKFVFLKFIDRKQKSGGFVDTFSDNKHKIIIDIDHIQNQNGESKLSGSMNIVYNQNKHVLSIHGFSN